MIGLLLGLIAVGLLGALCFGIPYWLLSKVPPAKVVLRNQAIRHEGYGYGGFGGQPGHFQSYGSGANDAYYSFSDGDIDNSVAGE